MEVLEAEGMTGKVRKVQKQKAARRNDLRADVYCALIYSSFDAIIDSNKSGSEEEMK